MPLALQPLYPLSGHLVPGAPLVPFVGLEPGTGPAVAALAAGTQTLTALAAVAQTLTELVELEHVAARLFPGLLPALSLYPGTDSVLCATTTIASTSLLCGATGPYPDDNLFIPESGLPLPALTPSSLDLAPLLEG